MDKDPFYPYLIKYSPYIIKRKAKVLDIFNTNKKCFTRINIESSPWEIWIRVRFLEMNGSLSLILRMYEI